MNNMKFDFDDITIIPARLSNVDSRKQIVLDYLPLIVSPMDTIIDNTNYTQFLEKGFEVCVPRGEKVDNQEVFISYGLDEIIEIIDKNQPLPKKVLIDVANGHMKKLYDTCVKIKKNYYSILMVGNIANPETFREYCEIGVDYVRCGIGGGSACFVKGTKIKTIDGYKNIEDIKIDDMVLTHKNNYKKVLLTHTKTSKKTVKINNNIECTTDHEFYVINKVDKDKIADNIHDFTYWISASRLDKDIHLLVKIDSFEEIISIEEIENNENVYDLSVEDDESYCANDFMVHNCTTSANTGIHFPMASLINECYNIACEFDNPSKIVADGGFKNYVDIIKAIALGADYVMLGGILNKCVESCSQKWIKIGEQYEKLDSDILVHFKNGSEIYSSYRGMSTKEVQKKWNRSELKTAEGISKLNKVEYTLSGWLENFQDYLKSNMSYTGKTDLESYKGEVEYVFITQNSLNRFKK